MQEEQCFRLDGSVYGRLDQDYNPLCEGVGCPLCKEVKERQENGKAEA